MRLVYGEKANRAHFKTHRIEMVLFSLKGGFMAGGDYLTIDEQRKLSKKEDYGMCMNGERVLKSGGAVKGE
jgi:hypothetical protein